MNVQVYAVANISVLLAGYSRRLARRDLLMLNLIGIKYDWGGECYL